MTEPKSAKDEQSGEERAWIERTAEKTLRAAPEWSMASSPAEDAARWRGMQGHVADLFTRATRLFPDVSVAQDLVQDTLERAVRAFPAIKPGTNLREWLYVIMMRRAADLTRHHRQHERSQEVPWDEVPAPELDSNDPSWMQDQMRDAIARLEPRLREVLELSEEQELSYAEIASRLGIRVTTVATRLRRAREHLRRQLLASLEQGASPDSAESEKTWAAAVEAWGVCTRELEALRAELNALERHYERSL